jgi:hypothetical protein
MNMMNMTRLDEIGSTGVIVTDKDERLHVLKACDLSNQTIKDYQEHFALLIVEVNDGIYGQVWGSPSPIPFLGSPCYQIQ